MLELGFGSGKAVRWKSACFGMDGWSRGSDVMLNCVFDRASCGIWACDVWKFGKNVCD